MPTLQWLRSIQRKYNSKPGLSDLRELQELVFDFDLGRYPFCLTDIGGYLGLALTGPRLRRVEIDTKTNSTFSSR